MFDQTTAASEQARAGESEVYVGPTLDLDALMEELRAEVDVRQQRAEARALPHATWSRIAAVGKMLDMIW